MGVQNIVKEITQYQKKWLKHVQRMDTNRLPKQALQYKPKGRRNIGRPRKRWRDQLHLEAQGTGNTPNPSGTWWWWWCLLLQSQVCYLSACHFHKCYKCSQVCQRGNLYSLPPLSSALINFTPRPLYPRERTPLPIAMEAGRVPEPNWTLENVTRLILYS